ELVREGHQLRIVFAGEANYTSDYGSAFRRELEIAEREGIAHHVGRLEIDALIRLFDDSLAAIHFPQVETFGLVVAEALARGLKFFGGREGGIIDITQDAPGAETYHRLPEIKAAIIRWLNSGALKVPEATA